MSPQDALRRAILNDDFPDDPDMDRLFTPVGEDLLKLNRNIALSAWMSQVSRSDINAGSPTWQADKDALVQGYFKNPTASNVSDEQLHSLVKTHIQTADEAADMAANMALQGRSSFEAVNEMNAKRGPSLVRGIWDNYTKDLVQRHSALSQKLAPYRGIVDAAASKLGKAMDWSVPVTERFQEVATQLLQVPEEDRGLVISAIGATGGATAEERASYLSKLAGAMGRMTETVGASSVGLMEQVGTTFDQLAQVPESIASALSGGVTLQGELASSGARSAALAKEKDDQAAFQILTQQIRQAADAEVSPIKGDGWWSQTGIDVARMVPQVAITVANPAIGMAANTAYFRDTVAAQAKLEDPTLTYQQADAIGTLTAPFNAAIETVTSLIPFGKVKLPFVQKWLSTASTSVKSTAIKFVVRAGVTVPIEVAEEMAQAIAPLWAQEALIALKMDMPDVDWEKRMPDFSQIAAQTWGPALVFGIVGGGAASISDIKNGRALAADRETMVASGIAPEMADQIATASEAGDWSKADELFRQEFVSPVKATPEQRQQATDKIQAKSAEMAEVEEALRKAETQGLIPRAFRDSQGWAVEDSDGAIVRTSSREDAVSLAYSRLDDNARDEAQAMARVLEAYSSGADILELNLGKSMGLSETGESEAAMKEAATTEAMLNGMTREQAEKITWAVLGSNRLETVEGVRRAVSRLFAGAGVMDAIEEPVEAKFQAGLEQGVFTSEEAVNFVKIAAEIMNAPELVTAAESSPRGLIEAVSDIVMSDTFGQRKDGKKGVAGAVTAGLKARLRGQSEIPMTNAKGETLSKFAAFLVAFRRFFKQVFQRSRALLKARKEGTLPAEFDEFLDKLMNVDPQARHEAAAAQEAMGMVPTTRSGRVVDPEMTNSVGEIEGLNAGVGGLTLEPGFAYRTVTTPEIADLVKEGLHLTSAALLGKPKKARGQTKQKMWSKRKESAPEKGFKPGAIVMRAPLDKIDTVNKGVATREEDITIVTHDGSKWVETTPAEYMAAKEAMEIADAGNMPFSLGASFSLAVQKAGGFPAKPGQRVKMGNVEAAVYSVERNKAGPGWWVVFDDVTSGPQWAGGERLPLPPFAKPFDERSEAVKVLRGRDAAIPRQREAVERLKQADVAQTEAASLPRYQALPDSGVTYPKPDGRSVALDKLKVGDWLNYGGLRQIASIERETGWVSFEDGFMARFNDYALHRVLKNAEVEELQGLEGWLQDRVETPSFSLAPRSLTERDLSTKWDGYPKTRGELTKEKIIKALKDTVSKPVSRRMLSKFVLSYDDAQDLLDHTYYHGTKNFISSTVKPSITLSDRDAAQMGGGGYGEKYWAISLSKSKRKAEVFSGQSSSVRVHPVLLKKSAKVISMPNVTDSADLDDHILDLWKNQVDAVWIGGGEAELAVINPKAIVFAEDADTYAVFGGYKSEDFTLEKAQKVMEQAREIIDNYDAESHAKLAFSLAPRSLPEVADTVLAVQMRRPAFREAFYELARQKMAKLRADGEWRVDKRGIASRRVGFDSRMAGIRSPANIEAERKFRLRSRQRELIDAGMLALAPETLAAYDAGVASLEDVPMVKDMLGKVGKIMSKSAAQKAGKLKTDGVGSAGDYDGAPRLPPAWYAKSGGSMPYEIAQELSDLGHLKDGYADTLWDAMRSAIYSTRTANEGFQKARDAVRKVEADALAQARKETDTWAKDETAKIPTEKDKQMMALRTLDAILSAFSPDIRAAVGGFVKLASLGSDKAREAEIIRRLDKLDEVVEKAARKHYAAKIVKALNKAAPVGKPGEVKKSKLIVTVQDEVDSIAEMVGMDSDDVAESISRSEAAIISAQTPEAAESALTELNLLELFGGVLDLKRTSSQELEVASEYLEELISQGREARKMIDEARRERVKEMVNTAKGEAFKGDAGPETTQSAKSAAANKSGKSLLKKFFNELSGFDGVLRDVFGAGSKTATEFSERFTLNSNQYEDVQNERRKRLRDFARELYGTKLGAKINQKLITLERIQNDSGVTYLKGREVKAHKLTLDDAAKIVADPKAFGFTTKEAAEIEEEMNALLELKGRRNTFTFEQVTKEGDRVEIPLSQMDALYISMALRQPGILEQQQRYGYDQETVDQLEKFLTDESKSWREWMQGEYDAEYQRANEVYMRMFNARMPNITFYAPLLKNHQGQQAVLDPLNTGISSNSANPGSIKSRKARTSSLRIDSALSVFWSHFNQMEYWIANAEYLRDVQAVMLNPDVRQSVVSAHGEDGMATVSAWVQLQMSRGVGKAALATAGSKMFRNVKSAISMKALALNLSTTLKTIPSVFYSLGEIHMSKWPAALVSGMKHWDMLWETNIIQRRLDIGGMPELRDLGSSALPMSWVNQGIRYGSYPTMYADGVFTTYSAAMAYGTSFDEAKRQGAGDEVAHKYAEERTALIVSKTAQPENWTQKSLFENDLSGAGSLFFMFTSDPRQKLALTGEALNRWRKGGATTEEAMRKLLAYWIIPGIMFQLANAIGRSLFKGDDDEWEVVDFATAALAGQLQGLALIGSAAEMIISAAIAAAAEKITGEEVKRKLFWNSPKNPLDGAANDLIKSVEKITEDDTRDGLGKAWEITKSAGMLLAPLSPAGAIPSTAERVMKDTTNLFYDADR